MKTFEKLVKIELARQTEQARNPMQFALGTQELSLNT